MQHENVVATIGNTPLIRLSNVTEGIVPATVYAKVEAFNPGQSAKDRVARYMIEQAEASGQLLFDALNPSARGLPLRASIARRVFRRYVSRGLRKGATQGSSFKE